MKLIDLDAVAALAILRKKLVEDLEQIESSTSILVTFTDERSGSGVHRISYMRDLAEPKAPEACRFDGIKERLQAHAQSRLEMLDRKLAALGVTP